MDDIIKIDIEDGIHVIMQKPFSDEFFGLFPQPCELSLKLYAPREKYE